jgi:hypothetical protein
MALNLHYVRDVFKDIELRLLRKLEKALADKGSGKQVSEAAAALETLRQVQADIEKEYEDHE